MGRFTTYDYYQMKETVKLVYHPALAPQELCTILDTLAEEYPIRPKGKGDIRVRFERVAGDECVVTRRRDEALIRYATPNMALRALSALLAGLVQEQGVYRESSSFSTFGIMMDCSRNAVMTVATLRKWMRRLALMGFNQVMLYTEDTYEIPGEPYFGYQRGRYAKDELKEMDAYAARLGIELVGCIQTLAHLDQITRWPPYQDICDYESTLLVGEPKTYELVGKMLDMIGDCFRTRRIHVGMDEAWHLGRGKYLDRHGGRRKFDIFNEHLSRVVAMSCDRGLKPMIWSDMYFTMGSPTHQYHDPKSIIPAAIAASIPKEVQLVYWDYNHKNKAFYTDWIGRHRAMGFEPLMASGIWTWGQFWYNRKITEETVGPCIEACRETGVKEIFFTMWGDDGGYCDYDSSLAGLAWAAERAFVKRPDERQLARRFRAVCDGDYRAVLLAAGITEPIDTPAILWDDPIIGLFANDGLPPGTYKWENLARLYATVNTALMRKKAGNAAGDLGHATLLADILASKITLRRLLEKSYDRRDAKGLRNASAQALGMAAKYQDLQGSFRRNWMSRNKPFGLDTIQRRIAGQIARYEELALRLRELLDGTVQNIPELDERPRVGRGGVNMLYRSVVSGSVIQ